MTTAYLDPGSGSLIISAVVGGAAGAAVAVKQVRTRVTGVFKRKGKQTDAVERGVGQRAGPSPRHRAEPAASATSAEAIAPGESA